jgi:transcriptional regulator with XRE-family HTH domain
MTEANIPLSAAIGRNLAVYRSEVLGWTQDFMAAQLRLHGVGWNRSQLAKVERGERAVSLEELLLLGLVLNVPLSAFFAGPNEWVQLTDRADVRLGAVAPMLGGSQPRQTDARFAVEEPPALDPAWPELGQADLALADAESHGEAEEKAAARLGVDPLTVARAARVAWGMSLPSERDRRAAAIASERSPASTVQASRGHITRDLTKELKPVIAERTKKARKR